MTAAGESNGFTNELQSVLWAALIGVLLRTPFEKVRRNMLLRLHEHGFSDLEAAHLIVLQYPGPQGQRPSDLANQLRMSKQALNYLLGQLEGFGYLERRPDPDDQRSKAHRPHQARPLLGSRHP